MVVDGVEDELIHHLTSLKCFQTDTMLYLLLRSNPFIQSTRMYPTVADTRYKMESSTSVSTSTSTRHQHRCKHPTAYLIITNISKSRNVKNLLQIAASFGAPKIFVVGQKSFDFDPSSETTDVPLLLQRHIASGRMEIVRFDKLKECVDYIHGLPCCEEIQEGMNGTQQQQQQQQTQQPIHVPVIGVEIDSSAKNLETEPFFTSAAIMMGNEGSGMTSKQMSLCDGFVRISQFGGGTASLNVSVAAGLVLHRYFHWGRGDAVKRCS